MKSPTTTKIGYRGNDNRGVHNRRGGMLIIVLIILAVSVILISSAMMVTLTARNRYYVSAEQDQAYLTALSTAKTLDSAIYTGLISDADITALAGNNATVTITGDAAPGMDGTSSASTTATFSQKGSGPVADAYIYVDIVTKIDANVETGGSQASVRLILKKRIPVDPGFQSLITIQAADNGMSKLTQCYFGDNAPAGATNMVVIKNNSEVSASSGQICFISDAIFTKRLDTGNNANFEANIVLWGPDAGINANGIGGNGINAEEYFLALGGPAPSVLPITAAGLPASTGYKPPYPDGGDAQSTSFFQNGAGSPDAPTTMKNEGISAKGLYISNSFFGTDFGTKPGSGIDASQFYLPNGIYADDYAIVSYQNLKQTMPIGKGTDAIMVTTGSTTTIDPAIVTSMKNEAKRITAQKTAIERSINTTKSSIETILINAGLLYRETDIEDAVDAKKFPDLRPFLSTGGTLTGSAYYLDLRKSDATVSANLIFDLTNNDITIYLLGDRKLIFDTGFGFKFINGTSYFGRMISASNCDIEIKPEWHNGDMSNVMNTPTGIYATTGTLKYFETTDHLGYSPDGSYGYYNPITGKTVPVTVGIYSSLYTYDVTRSSTGIESPIPHFYAYLFGATTIEINTGAVLQGYYALTDDKSEVAVNGNPIFYCRMEVADIHGTGGDSYHFPYCPAPDAGGEGDDGSASVYKFFGYETL